ncbi:MAG: methyltransferase domain-containing protein [Bryobacteraceae bacterium]
MTIASGCVAALPVSRTPQEIFYPESAFGGFTDIDGTIAFYTRVNSLVQPSFRVIDHGCGRGAHSEDPILWRRNLRALKGKANRVIGLDVDSDAAYGNPSLDEYHPLLPGGRFPVEDRSANLILSDCVLEHLADPGRLFSEAARVLLPGGYLCIRTPNRLSYVGLASMATPNRLHAKVLKKVQAERKQEDVFPTLYRCNTVYAIRRQMAEHGFRAAVYGYEAEPSYLEFSRLAYWLGVLHQRFAPSFLRPAIFAFGRLR